MDSPSDDFAGLLSRVRTGEARAFEELAQKYGPALQRTARMLLGRALRSQLDTLDLVQTVHQALLTVIRDGKLTIGDSEQLCGLALTILRRKIARRWRDAQQDPGAVALPLEPHDPTGGCEPADTELGPAEAALLKDELETVLGSADELDRRAIELRLAGSTTADAARELGIDPAALRMRFGRLRKRLREAADESTETPEPEDTPGGAPPG